MNKESFAFVIYMIHACANHLMFINYCRIVDVSIIILSLIMMFSILREQNILLKILKNILGSEV